MKILLFLLLMALFLLILTGIGFIWAVRSKQFEDLEGPAYRILFDEDEILPPIPDAIEKTGMHE